MSLRIKRWGWQQSVLLAGALCLNVDVRAASADDEKADENRWDIFKDGKDRLKFDKQSGDMYRLERDDSSALVWVKVTVRVTTVASTKPKSAAPVIQPDENAQASTTEEKPKRPKSAAPEIFDTEGNNITDVITDFDRRQSAPAIVAYEKNLSVCNAVQIGDRISGTFLIKNKGDRKLKALELTMLVPVVGKDKPEEHRFLFADKPGTTNPPPQPGSGGREPEALLQKVDIACPAGHSRGSSDLKITFLKFAD